MFSKNHYSQELTDIIERPQGKFSVAVFCFLLFFVTLLIALGIIIKSPDVVVSEVRVSTGTPPIVLTSQTKDEVTVTYETDHIAQATSCFSSSSSFLKTM